jgi:hypothetical protein
MDEEHGGLGIRVSRPEPPAADAPIPDRFCCNALCKGGLRRESGVEGSPIVREQPEETGVSLEQAIRQIGVARRQRMMKDGRASFIALLIKGHLNLLMFELCAVRPPRHWRRLSGR